MTTRINSIKRDTKRSRTPEHQTTEHATPTEQRSTPEQWRNNGKLPGTPAKHPPQNTNRTPTEHQWNTLE